MLQNIKELYGKTLAATDGEIGHVKDFYFDDLAWAVRYLVVDTGTWLNSRQVLISPHAFGKLDRDKDILAINLTKAKIEGSPSIDRHLPVSRQYEQDYYQYYGWPAYWEGGGMWGVAGFPIVDPTTGKREALHHGHNQRDDVHLRSTKAVTGYDIQATDGAIGSVRSFMVDDKTWAVAEIVVETGHWYSGKEILVTSKQVLRVNYEESRIYVSLLKADLQRTADNAVVKAGV